MSVSIGHLQFNVPATSLPFYRDVFTDLGWSVLHFGPDGMLGLGASDDGSLWFTAVSPNAAREPNGSDGIGLNHLALGVSSIAAVYAAAAVLTARGVPLLFETPRHRAEFNGAEG